MEPRVDIGPWKELTPPTDTIERYYEHCACMVEDCYHDQVKRTRERTFGDWVTPDIFLREYVWVVFASGFNSKVLAEKFDALMECYSNVMLGMSGSQIRSDFDYRWQKVSTIIANEAKHDAVRQTVVKMSIHYHHGGDWWGRFKKSYLCSVDAMTKLPRIAEVTKFHLARNLGYDAVKPDKHLVRLAEHFGFDDPESMCNYLSGLYGERIGVVDLVLFYGASTWGTNGVLS